MAACTRIGTVRQQLNLAIVLLLSLLWQKEVVAAATVPFTSVAQARTFTPNSDKIPVRLLATAISYQSSEHLLFVSDSSGDIAVETSHAYGIGRGDLVEISGTIKTDLGSPMMEAREILGVGKGNPPLPLHRTYRELLSGGVDCQPVIVRGKVRSALFETRNGSRTLGLELMMNGGIVEASVQDPTTANPDKLIDSDIEVRGVVKGTFNAQHELMRNTIYIAGSEDLRILRTAHIPRSRLPLTDLE